MEYNRTSEVNTMKDFIIKHKKICIGAIIAVLAVAIVIAVLITRNTSSDNTDLSTARTVTLEKGDLTQSVTVSGSVTSASVSELTTDLTYKVVTLNVKLGDMVKKGDVIAVLDTTEIEQKIAEKQEEIASQESSSARELQKAYNALSDAKTAYSKVASEQSELVSSAKKALDSANSTLTSAKNDFDKVKEKIKTEQEAYDKALKAKQEAFDTWADKLDAYNKAKDSEDQKSIDKAEEEEKKAADELEKAEKVLNGDSDSTDRKTKLGASGVLDEAKENNNYNAIEDAYNSANSAQQAANETYQEALKAQSSALDDANQSIKSAQETISDLQSKSSTLDTELETLQKQKESATLKAATTGEITSLSVSVGSIPKGSICTIQSTTELILEVTIPESSINKVSKGLKVEVTADSVDEPVEGTLTQISSTANSSSSDSSSSSSTSEGYKAQITLKKAGGLHIGSKAKGKIIISEKTGVYSVPIDAVGMDEDGNNYVRVQQSDGTFKNIMVTTGEQNDTEIEIKGLDLEEGLNILSDANYEDLLN